MRLQAKCLQKNKEGMQPIAQAPVSTCSRLSIQPLLARLLPSRHPHRQQCQHRAKARPGGIPNYKYFSPESIKSHKATTTITENGSETTTVITKEYNEDG